MLPERILPAVFRSLQTHPARDILEKFRRPQPELAIPAGVYSALGLLGRLGLRHGPRRRDLAHGSPKGVRVLAGAYLTRRFYEALALGLAVVTGSLALCHG